jgi:hypothetical protein
MKRNPRFAIIAAAVMLLTTCMSAVPCRALVVPVLEPTIGDPDTPSNPGRAVRVGLGHLIPLTMGPYVFLIPNVCWSPVGSASSRGVPAEPRNSRGRQLAP